jgi:GAF domain-containing protein/anti-sigma regulatory factor (Ser/Thr protein kinase)
MAKRTADPSVAELADRIAHLERTLAATSDVLRSITRAPGELQQVLDTIAESAARLCDGESGLQQLREEGLVVVAACSPAIVPGQATAVTRGSVGGRALVEGRTVEVCDLAELVETEFPDAREDQRRLGHRAVLAVPLLSAEGPIGVLQVFRREPRPFSPEEARLLESFADQAVIAIENARLLTELQGRLEEQTATADILRAISRSPTSTDGVLPELVRTAARLCSADDGAMLVVEGDLLRQTHHHGTIGGLSVGETLPIDRTYVTGRAVIERRTIHVEDIQAVPESELAATPARLAGVRTGLATPLLRDGVPIGVFAVRRTEVRPFTEQQIRLLESFADQAVIAIENARLFSELSASNAQLSEALEQQTATSEVLEVIAGSPTELPRVLETILATAARLCDAPEGFVRFVDGEKLVLGGWHGPAMTEWASARGADPLPVDQPAGHQNMTSLAIARRRTVRFDDPDADPELGETARTTCHRTGLVSMLAVPLLRGGEPVGAILLARKERLPFSDAEVALVESFAHQAVIAIENARLFAELRERLEAQTATSEVLRAISASPTDLQGVLDTIADSAARLCGAADAAIFQSDGEWMWSVARRGPAQSRMHDARRRLDEDSRRTVSSLPVVAAMDKRTIHVPDTLLAPGREEFEQGNFYKLTGVRSRLAAPLLREGNAIGAIVVDRPDPTPFTDRQIGLLESFADQAVIAMENARLFQELQERLEAQTATSEVLETISRSSTDLQTVLDTIADSAARLCESDHSLIGLVDGDRLRSVAGVRSDGVRRTLARPGPLGQPLGERSTWDRLVLQGQLVHIADLDTFPSEELWAVHFRRDGLRTILAVPLLRGNEVLGGILLSRQETRPFTERHIALVQTFADQAVIAIENARLFTELQERNAALSEALDQQTTTAEVLRVISAAPTDLPRVLGTICESAARLCESDNARIWRVGGDRLLLVANHGDLLEREALAEGRPIVPGTLSGRAAIEGRTVHVPDLEAAADEFPEAAELARRFGIRTMLSTPLLRDGVAVGVIHMRRHEVRPFTERQIALLETFADQAVIAMENARLFQELQERLEEQTASARVLRAISEAPTDLPRVLRAVVAAAGGLCEGSVARIYRLEGDVLTHVASTEEQIGSVRRLDPGWAAGRCVLERRTIHLPDVALSGDEYPITKELARQNNFRSLLVTPLMRRGEPIGVLSISYSALRPFGERQIAQVESFADQAVIAMENARLFEELTDSVSRLSALFEVGQAISATLDLDEVLRRVLGRAIELSHTDGGSIYEFEAATERFLPRAISGRMSPELAEALERGALGMNTQLGDAVRLGGPLQVPDLREVERNAIVDGLIGMGYHALLIVPLLREGRPLGALVVRRRGTGEFPAETERLLQTFAGQAALAIQNARLFQELDAASRHKSEFLANMSHELRTPLNAIIGFSEVLLEKYFGEINAKQEEYLRDVLTSGQHLLSLINDILDLSKVEAGRMELDLSTFALQPVLESGLVMVKERAQRNGVGLGLDVAAAVGRVEGDERKVKQVVFNLLSNAVKFTPSGGRIDVRAWRDGEVHVAVRDTGVGIAPEEQARIFEEFGQARHRAAEGTGLGLTLTKRFVELHGGRIWVESAPGHGSTFTFTLPVRQEAKV